MGWREIAAFLGVHPRTAKKYFYEKGLPIYRGTGRPRTFEFALIEWISVSDEFLKEGKLALRKPPLRKGKGRNQNP